MPPLSPFNRTCLALAIQQILALPTQAATIEVNSSGDPAVGGGNDGVCTLREAIVSINASSDQTNGCNGSGFGANDTITFSQGLSGITLERNQETIERNVDIIGPGQGALTIDGNQNFQLFSIYGATVSLNSLTISGGSSVTGGAGIYARNLSKVSISHSTVSGNSTFYGGGIFANIGSTVSLYSSTVSENTAYKGGGIYADDSSSVSLTNSTVSENTAYKGGGIYADDSSSVSLTNSTVSNNSANNVGGGISAFNTSSVNLANSTVSSNSAVFGGGIYANASSSVNLSNSTVLSNSASNKGGGIYFIGSSSVNLSNSTVSSNSSDRRGGGIFTDSSSVNLTNSTVSNNSSARGGGIYVYNNSSANLSNSTVSNNSAGHGGGIYTFGSSVSLANSIISGNTVPSSGSAEIRSVSSSIIAAHNNLFAHNSLTLATAFYGFTPGISDINATSVDDTISTYLPTASAAILSTLYDNGCTQKTGAPSSEACVQTNALLAASPAIGAADFSVCANTDQRGKPRDEGFFVPIKATNGKLAVVDLGEGKCDIGSVEYQPGD